MNINLEEKERTEQELFFNILDRDTGEKIGILFTVANHIAYEVYEEFRGQGVATDALRIITSQIPKPVLEITYDNIASKRVALKAGYVFKKKSSRF